MEKLVWKHKNQFAALVNKVVANRDNLITTLGDYEKEIKYFSSLGKDDSESNVIKGDMFEVLSAIFFNRMGDSPHVGLNDYQVVALEEDYGVDAVGVNVAGIKTAVQVKFRSSPNNLITYPDLAKTFTYSIVRKWSEPDSKNSIWLFTNTKGVTPACTTVLGNRLKVISRDEIKHHLDGNVMFWKNFIAHIFKILRSG
jgi:hypothetical protein